MFLQDQDISKLFLIFEKMITEDSQTFLIKNYDSFNFLLTLIDTDEP